MILVALLVVFVLGIHIPRTNSFSSSASPHSSASTPAWKAPSFAGSVVESFPPGQVFSSATASRWVRLQPHSDLGRPAPGEYVTLEIALRHRPPAMRFLKERLRNVSSPAHPMYGQHLSHERVAEVRDSAWEHTHSELRL